MAWCINTALPHHDASPCLTLAQVDLLLGDPTKAQRVLGWNPQSTSLEQLCHEMGE